MEGLTNEEIQQIRDELETAKKPLFFFHDDPDGLSSFLLLYRYIKEGKGVVVKSQPIVDEKFLQKVEQYQPDKIFVLDLALIDENFAKQVKCPIIWIDHHQPQKIENTKYFNPRTRGNNAPASYLCYQIANQDRWIAMVGIVGDWFIPPFADEFADEYPGLIRKGITSPPEMLFDTKLGELIKAFSFILKGKTGEALKAVELLKKINSPLEILDQSTEAGKKIFKRYEKTNKEYIELRDRAELSATADPILLFSYTSDEMSFTGDISNEMLYRHPDKVIIIAREKSGEMRMSIRSKDVLLPPIIEKALIGVDGHGGGHEHACGSSVKKEHFEQFINTFREELE